MILSYPFKDYKKMIATGQIMMVTGILFTIISLNMVPGVYDFWRGFLIGLGITLLVASAILNLKGILLYRKSKSEK